MAMPSFNADGVNRSAGTGLKYAGDCTTAADVVKVNRMMPPRCLKFLDKLSRWGKYAREQSTVHYMV
jgi:hypothetical protein